MDRLKKKEIKRKYFISSFDKQKINYIVIPKCASTSMLYYLLKKENKNIISTDSVYLHSVETIKFITKEEAENNSYFNFTLVRNPITRALSCFKDFCYYRTTLGGGGGSKEFFNEFEKIRKKKDIYEMFKMVSSFPNTERGNHFRSQISFCILDDLELYKVETSKDLKKLNSTKDLKENIISPIVEDIIYQCYPEDFNLWNKVEE